MRLSNRNIREEIASDYLYFRHPTEYIFILLPPVIGVILNIFMNYGIELESVDVAELKELQFQKINTYLITTQFVMMFLISLFVCYRWTNMKFDGSYKFWLTQGMERKDFYILIILKFSLLLYIADILGLMLLMYLNQYQLSLTSLILLNIVIYVSNLWILSFSLLISELISIPEISTILYITLIGGSTILGIRQVSTLNYLAIPKLNYQLPVDMVALPVTLLLIGVTMIMAYLINSRREILS